jgi:uncharacterized Fe-S cluster protein YjdI/CDGSH-type Zn-finger protein
MAGRQRAERTYETDRIAVHWDSSRCIHTARCLNALPQVFDVARRPWVELGAADADAVAAAVQTCPTGALRFRRLDGGPQDEPMSPDGETLADADDLWLCRCGQSGSKPFCDTSHKGQFESRLVQVDGDRRRAETPAAFEPNRGVVPPPEAAEVG